MIEKRRMTLEEAQAIPGFEEAKKRYYDEAYKQGTSTEPVNLEKCKELIIKLHKRYFNQDIEGCEFLVADSIKEAEQFTTDRGVDFKTLERVSFTYWWSGYYTFYRFLIEFLGLKFTAKKQAKDLLEQLDLMYELCREVPTLYTFNQTVIIVDRPAVIHKDRVVEIQGQQVNVLHNDKGPAIVTRKGLALYCLNGIPVPAHYVTTPADELSIKEVMTEGNVDVRRELLRKVGLERFMRETKAKVLDKETLDMGTCKSYYELLELDLGEFGKARVLKMSNPSIKADHIEGVEDDCDTVKEAIAWRAGFDHKKVEVVNKSLS